MKTTNILLWVSRVVAAAIMLQTLFFKYEYEGTLWAKHGKTLSDMKDSIK